MKQSLCILLFMTFLGGIASADDSDRLLTIDHYVRVTSTVPAIAGQPAQLYVRERVLAGGVLRTTAFGDRVVLFVHGAGTPAEVAFDVPYQDYSWMAFLARAGFDVFSVDMTGYGRSTRPAPMNDPCNLAKDRQAGFVAAPCAAAYPHTLTSIASDWNDLDAAVNYIRTLRHVDRVSLVAWSRGGPRAGGYAAQHPDKVRRLVVLAPAYDRRQSGERRRGDARRRRPDEHAIQAGFRCELGSAGRMRRAIRPRRRQRGMDRHARIRPGRRDVGPRRPARSGDRRHLAAGDGEEADRAVPDGVRRS